jgi:type VI secretion system secreted protein Hcp
MIFMKHDGIKKGSSTTKGHLGSEGWTEITDVQWGAGRGITAAHQGAEREAGSPSVSDMTVRKSLDISSYRWFEEGLWGDGHTVTIHFTKTNKDQQDVYMEYILDNVLVSRYSTTSDGDRPTEELELNFTRIEYNYCSQDAKNDKGETPKTEYNLAANANKG